MYCMNCGKELPEGAMSCRECGTPLVFCDSCGEILYKGAKYCNKCGAAQGPSSPIMSDKTRPRFSIGSSDKENTYTVTAAPSPFKPVGSKKSTVPSRRAAANTGGSFKAHGAPAPDGPSPKVSSAPSPFKGAAARKKDTQALHCR